MIYDKTSYYESKIENLCYKGLCVLLLLMPFHYFICEVIFGWTSIDNIWRDIVILSCAVPVILTARHGKLSFVIISLVLIVLLFSLTGNNIVYSLNIARVYIIPMMSYYLAVGARSSSVQRTRLFSIILFGAVVAGLFGIIQVVFLGNDYLIRAGYAVQDYSSFYINGYYGIPRLVSTFSSPNEAGAFFVLSLLVSRLVPISWKPGRYILQGIILIALLLTFSRSAYFALILSLLYIKYVEGSKKHQLYINFKALAMIAGIFIFVGITLSVIPQYREMLVSLISNTLSGSNLSMNKHLEDLYLPIGTVLQNPLGLGFGNNGPQALLTNPNANLVESGLYLSMYEFGPLLGSAYFIPAIWITIVASSKQRIPDTKESALCGAASLVYLTICLALPVTQGFTLPFYSYVFIGIYQSLQVMGHDTISVDSIDDDTGKRVVFRNR